MKKILAIALAVAMIIGLCSCNSNNGPEPNSAVASNNVAQTSESHAEAFEPMELKVSSILNQTDGLAECLTAMMDYVTEQTGGAVTFQVYWSSTFCSQAEELYFIQSGDIDMCQIQQLHYRDVLPLSMFPQTFVGSVEDSKEYFYNVMFNNTETASLIANELSEYNGVCLGLAYTGQQGLYAKKDWSSLEDLMGKKVGCVDPVPLNYLGLSTAIVPPAEGYENLDRGVIDAACSAFGGYMDMMMYEVAPFFGQDGTVVWGSPYIIREDLWNTFSPELQQIFYDAAEIAADMSVEIDQRKVAEQIELVESTGGHVFALPEADQLKLQEAYTIAGVETALETAEAQGNVEDITTVYKYALELLGYDWTW